MSSSIRIAMVRGIPIELHISWFLIFILLTWSLASGNIFDYPGLTAATRFVVALITSLLFFASVLLHELGHAFVALRREVPVKRITLFIFGGLAQIEKEPPTPTAEFLIAIAGPLVSFGLAGLFGVLWFFDQAVPALAAPSIWLARINFLLAAFNMIPGFPLDGGRVLRAIIWGVTKSFYRATQVSASIGTLVAYGFIGFGIFDMFRGRFFNGLWLIFIGSFLQNAAANNAAASNMRHALQGIEVDQVMDRDYPLVAPLLTLQQLVDERVFKQGQRYFFICEDEQLKGMLTLSDISKVPQRKWRFTTTQEIMVPFARLITVNPQQPLWDALETMDTQQVGQVPVVSGDEILGVLSRERVMHHVTLRSELGA